MKSHSDYDHRGPDDGVERDERPPLSTSPDAPTPREQTVAPGATQDVWKRFIDNRLRPFGSRGN